MCYVAGELEATMEKHTTSAVDASYEMVTGATRCEMPLQILTRRYRRYKSQTGQSRFQFTQACSAQQN